MLKQGTCLIVTKKKTEKEIVKVRLNFYVYLNSAYYGWTNNLNKNNFNITEAYKPIYKNWKD